jgi:hypothetical protein
MKTRLFPTLGMLAILLAACASPQATQPPAPPLEQFLPSSTAVPPVVSTDLSATPNPVLEPATQAPPPVATSRGPDLHATDPTTVSLASGQYQLVEFFRFT